MKTNLDVRIEILRQDVKMYEVADALGYSRSKFYKLMRTEMGIAEKNRVLDKIQDIADYQEPRGAIYV